MISVSPAKLHHVGEICELFVYQFGRNPGFKDVQDDIMAYPAVVVLAQDTQKVIGFALTEFFSPDTLRLKSILIREDYRGRGIGAFTLGQLNRLIPQTWNGLIACDGHLSMCNGKLDNSNFFLSNGFAHIAKTCDSNIFFASLPLVAGKRAFEEVYDNSKIREEKKTGKLHLKPRRKHHA